MEFRKLKPEEIDVKVGSVTKLGCTLLLYKNARVDMAILDETVGMENWQRDHKEVKGNLYCGIGINVGSILEYENANPITFERWVWKWDCGVESAFGDKEKGEASDSFKRAGFNWGIGRELYTSPFIFVECETEYDEAKKVYKLKNAEEKKRIASLKVQEISYNNKGEIEKLVIVDGKGVQIYPKVSQVLEKPKTATIQSTGKYVHCIECDEEVSQKVAEYSLNKYGRILCFDCQKLEANKDE